MSTKTIGVVGRGSGWQKVGIELGSYVVNPNSSQPGMFQTFAPPQVVAAVLGHGDLISFTVSYGSFSFTV